MHRNLDQLKHTQIDLLVIGGGIYGISIARDAVLRGLNVALIEANDFGSGTSHNSLKIIHGGIRYLQHLNFKRVQESVREREMWISISNKFIKPLKFVLPTYGYGTRGPIALSAAVNMHNFVAAIQNKNRAYPNGYMMSKSKCEQLIPELNDKNISGAAVWYDGQITDADRLHIELLKDAHRRGLCLANYLKAEKLHIAKRKVYGVTATDQLNNSSFDIKANVVVNATGPWAFRLLNQNFKKSKYQNQILSKNFNIVVDHIGKNFAFGVKSKRMSDAVVGSSKRIYFLTPWLDKTVIGTAHFLHDDSENLSIKIDEELPDFIDEINEAYPALNMSMKDICYSYSGFTPAEPDDRKKSASRSHHTSIIDHNDEDGVDNLLSVIGVKYTTSRSTAQQVVDSVCSKLEMDTSNAQLPSNYIIDERVDEFSKLNDLCLKATISEHEINSVYRQHIDQHIQYAIEEEMAVCIEDYILRRSNLAMRGHLDNSDIEKIALQYSKTMSINVDQTEPQLKIIKQKLNFA